jgi:predicted small secreted protein
MKHLKITLLLSLASASILATSCATTRGFGQDMEKVGNKIEHQANKTGGAN